MKVLYVEDEKYMARALEKVLKKNNYNVDLAYNGEDGLDFALTNLYDIIILDIMLPKRDGISILREIRRQGLDTPVLLLTAKGETEDKVAGLDSGADDYLPKPFQAEELLARLRALARRKGQVAHDNLLHFGDIDLNPHTLDLYKDGQSFHLTLKESQLLELLIAHQGITVPASTIIEKLWGYDTDTEDSHVRVHAAFLRKKLIQLGSHVKIQSIRGIGYVLTLGDR
ncbi:MAG: response regulator transcription factor [Peptococcaceae bacterium]|nr:response regulator transcription factor [Peptococcaceae bacterium]